MIELVVIGATLAHRRRCLRRARAAAHHGRANARALCEVALAHLRARAARQGEPARRGTKNEVTFTIDLVKITGPSPQTRVRAPVTKGTGATDRGRAARRDRARAPHARRGTRSPSASRAFDDAYRMHGMAPDEARAWLEESLEDLVCLDERSDVWLGSDGATVTLAWSGVEMNPLLLDCRARRRREPRQLAQAGIPVPLRRFCAGRPSRRRRRRVRGPRYGMTGGPERRDESVNFSLKELMKLEDERIGQEKRRARGARAAPRRPRARTPSDASAPSSRRASERRGGA